VPVREVEQFLEGFSDGPHRVDTGPPVEEPLRTPRGPSWGIGQWANNSLAPDATLNEWPYRARVRIWEGFTVCPAQSSQMSLKTSVSFYE
jgi:hypothetical protein